MVEKEIHLTSLSCQNLGEHSSDSSDAFFFGLYLFYYICFFNWRIIALQYWVHFCHISVNQPRVYMCPLRFEPPSHLPPHLTPLGCLERQVELPALYSIFLLAICFTYGNLCVSMLLSQFVPASPSHTVCTSLFTMSASLLLPCR